MKEYDFYIVPTPIGNLSDITYRAIDILKSVDLIACEDSRNTQKLLNYYNIKTKCISYHKYNERERVDKIIEFLENGGKMALVSDAGTPLICDPGSIIIKELRKKNFKVTALPGANAVITFISQITRDDEQFAFAGFLPRIKNQIENIFKNYETQNLVFYESPNRIVETLEILQGVRPESKLAIGRELTKVYEEVIVDNLENLLDHFRENSPRGEFVVMIFKDSKEPEDQLIETKVKLLKNKGFTNRDISVILSELYGINKNKIYKITLSK